MSDERCEMSELGARPNLRNCPKVIVLTSIQHLVLTSETSDI